MWKNDREETAEEGKSVRFLNSSLDQCKSKKVGLRARIRNHDIAK